MGVGKVVTLFSNDAQKILEGIQFFNAGILVPFQFGGAIALIWTQLGAYSLITVGILVVTAPITTQITKKLFFHRIATLRQTDKRVKLTNQFLQMIRIIKYYAWENFLVRQILGVRKEELKSSVHFSVFKCLNKNLYFLTVFNHSPFIACGSFLWRKPYLQSLHSSLSSFMSRQETT